LYVPFDSFMTHKQDSVTSHLLELRKKVERPVPSPALVSAFIDATLGVLFPHFSRHKITTEDELTEAQRHVHELLAKLCAPVIADTEKREALPALFVHNLAVFHETLWADAEAICEGDPAATSPDEVLLAYPGFFAIAVFRIAHWLYQAQVPIVPRMLTEHAHQLTGIDIHPGATIGKAFVIDHGTGIVIGETTTIEDHVKIYQGVTLGALSVNKSLANKKRHPTIGHHTVIYANATILGGDTVIGAHSTIGGNVWLTSSVPEHSKIYHRSQEA
jgi:serine O-acetyltransferase